jgi:hypothetical protein
MEDAISLRLPKAVVVYLAAEKAKEPDIFPFCFADNARVHDESRDYQGLAAIKSWARDAQAKYQYVVEPLQASMDDQRVNLRARLTGNFPGSPVELEHVFTLEGGKIISLEIQ